MEIEVVHLTPNGKRHGIEFYPFISGMKINFSRLSEIKVYSKGEFYFIPNGNHQGIEFYFIPNENQLGNRILFQMKNTLHPQGN